MTTFRIFYAWQSDRPANLCRSLIRRALDAAAENLQDDLAIDDAPRVEFEIDQDTRGKAGSPPVAETILQKIRESDAFVADLTFTGCREGKSTSPVPNPNVLTEYGYALHALSEQRVIAVFNEEFGSCELLPFDIKHRRWPIRYCTSGEGSDEPARKARCTEREQLAGQVAEAIKTIVKEKGKREGDSGTAIANLKRYISDPQSRIELMDLIDAQVERVIELTSTEAYAVKGVPVPDTVSVTARVREYETACSTLLDLAAVGGYWAEKEHHAVWKRALAHLYPSGSRSGNALLLDLQKYPATLLFYTLGLGAVEADRLDLLGSLVEATVARESDEEVLAVTKLPPALMFSGGGKVMEILQDMERHYAPLNAWLHDALRHTMRRLIPDDDQYTFVFDKFEILTALACGYRRRSNFTDYWAPPGAFGYRHTNRTRIIGTIRRSLEAGGEGSPFVTSGIFGRTAEECRKGLTDLEDFVPGLRWW